jgi:hypothetical protein
MCRNSDADKPALDERRGGRALVGVVFVVVWGLITHGTFAGSGDEPHYMMVAHSLVFDGDLDLANDYANATLIGGGTLRPEAHARWNAGHLRPVHDIGMPLIFAPFVGAAYRTAEWLGEVVSPETLSTARLNTALLLRHQMSLVMAIVTGLLARELFLLLRVCGSTASAFWWTLLFALSPPILSHSFLFFTEVPSALGAMLVFRRLATPPVPSSAMSAVLGCFSGILLLVHARNVGLVVGLCAVATLATLEGRLSRRGLLLYLCGVTLGTGARTAATYVMWNSFITTPHATLGVIPTALDSVYEVFVRLTGLFFDREHGLLAYAPVYALLVPGLAVLARERSRIARDVLVVVVCYLLPILLPTTNVHGWSGGWSPAARFLVPVLGLLWIAVYRCARPRSSVLRALVVLLVLVQLSLDAFVWQAPRTLWNDGDGISALRMTHWLPTWAIPGEAAGFVVAMITSAVVGALVAWRFQTQAGETGGELR